MTYQPPQGGPGQWGQGQGQGGPGQFGPPQQGFPPPGYGPPGYGPPKKSKAGLVVGIVLGLVVVIGGTVAILGFVAPGFFLTKEEDNGTVGGQSVPDPRTVATSFLEGLNTKQEAAANWACKSAKDQVAQSVHSTLTANWGGRDFKVATVGPNADVVQVGIQYFSFHQTRNGNLTLHKGPGDGYCVSSFDKGK